MLTKEYLDKKFITAHFCDNEREQIEVITKSEDEKSVVSTVIPFDKKHPWCEMLFEYITLDQLHENTWNKIQEERDNFKRWCGISPKKMVSYKKWVRKMLKMYLVLLMILSLTFLKRRLNNCLLLNLRYLNWTK